MASMMEKSQAAREETEFNLREWGLKARISRENTISRRFSASNIRSFREDTKSFRSNFTISSTASSPGYPYLREEIDPSTYSFTTALKALQARSVYNSWDCSSPEGFALNSKWNEAEKYICNPLSGEFPKECLSAKTLSGRSFSNFTNRITMSAPLIYNSSHHSRPFQTNHPSITLQERHHVTTTHEFPLPDKKILEGSTRDVGTQSTPPDLSSASPSPASTPSIVERSLKCFEAEAGDSPNSFAKMKPEDEVEAKETGEKQETKGEKQEEEKWRQGGCLSWMRKRHREKHKPRKNHYYLPSLKGC